MHAQNIGTVVKTADGYQAQAKDWPCGFSVTSLASGAEALVQNHDARSRPEPRMVSNVYG